MFSVSDTNFVFTPALSEQSSTHWGRIMLLTASFLFTMLLKFNATRIHLYKRSLEWLWSMLSFYSKFKMLKLLFQILVNYNLNISTLHLFKYISTGSSDFEKVWFQFGSWQKGGPDYCCSILPECCMKLTKISNKKGGFLLPTPVCYLVLELFCLKIHFAANVVLSVL